MKIFSFIEKEKEICPIMSRHDKQKNGVRVFITGIDLYVERVCVFFTSISKKNRLMSEIDRY